MIGLTTSRCCDREEWYLLLGTLCLDILSDDGPVRGIELTDESEAVLQCAGRISLCWRPKGGSGGSCFLKLFCFLRYVGQSVILVEYRSQSFQNEVIAAPFSLAVVSWLCASIVGHGPKYPPATPGVARQSRTNLPVT